MEYAENIGKTYNVRWISKKQVDNNYAKICIDYDLFCYAYTGKVSGIIQTDDNFELYSYIIYNWIKTFDYTIIRHGIYRDKFYSENILSKCLITFDMKVNYIGLIYCNSETREFKVVLDDAGQYREIQNTPAILPDNLPDFKTKMECERPLRIEKFNPNREYWPNPKLRSYFFPSASWYLKIQEYGIVIDNDVLGIEYKRRNSGSHDSHILDLLLRMEIPLFFVKKLLQYYDSETMSISEMVEDVLYKLLGGDVDLENIVKMKRPPRSNVIDHNYEEHIKDFDYLSIKIDCKQTYPAGRVPSPPLN